MDKDDVIRKVGLKIREIRENQELSIMSLADKLDIEYNNMIRIEKGRTNPTLGTLYKICQALNVKLIDIVNVE
ncbi:transcriptional regulator with XRE-family HTH domain [Dysgonomonas hofstadii]|uniref:Transcriptional regulator with XRE-family HTH domain n=1 Tax=Dysgonomonas hofstadii TaxID=637886 RepID=A0A840CTY6_9BACT|nr:helix-turn-helix transcriptional regulator [Dysgonomonas hofstadii]MBB4037658.1 transcriptional regulator with XRE-family HTH domain [Dysgonomonas hofstadii]